jgi:hypothetical protein
MVALSAGETIVAEFRAFGVGRQRDLFCARTAFEIVDRCEHVGVGILGIDGFYLTDKTTMPQDDHVLDLSTASRAYDDARDFLRRGDGLPLFYEFTLDDHDADAGEGPG